MQAGSRVRVGVAAAGVGEAEVISCEPQQTLLKLLQRIDLVSANPPWENLEVDLLLAMTRPKVLERILQLCAVVGVRRVYLVCAARTEKGFFSSSRLAAENLLEQFELGLEQGMVTRPPELHAFASWEGFLAATAAAEAAATAAAAAPPRSAAAAASHAGDAEEKEPATAASDGADTWAHYLLPPLRLVAHPHTEATLPQLLFRPVAEATSPHHQQDSRRVEVQKQQQQQRTGVLLAVGPEGGWIPSEMDLLQQQLRCLPFRLTDKVLKCETALTACLTQLTLCYEDRMFLPLLRSPDEIYAAAAAAAGAVAVANGGAAAEPERAEAPTCPAAERREPPKRQGEREILRAPGGFIMSFPRRYVTRREPAGPHQQQQQQQQQQEEEHELV
ncbi:hypothetical protein, conserved [Eimeria praecox]|uniref:16S rRNA (uracil(1498)-N(3))-methyltransferase n=1 Tax=Eimeria praecox TaxID=51316 RepID=U6HAH0_9EIME|nr:hypothetical protein, conserved [Eimeria praecox]